MMYHDFGINSLECTSSLNEKKKKKQKLLAFVSGCYVETLNITLEDEK